MTYEIPGATPRVIDVGDVALSVYDAGPADGPAVVLSHGFPELAYSWRRQIPALAERGYHVIAPDQRGYGGSGRPEAVTAYDIFHLTGDLAFVLDAFGHDDAVFVGHDWGGLVVWQMALLQPERVAGVVGVNTPYIPRLPIKPIDLFRQARGDSHYIVWFQSPDVPDAALASDVPLLFTRLLRTGVPPEEVQAATGGSANVMEAVVAGPAHGDALLDDQDLEVYVSEFERTGFTGGINWYRNMDRNWELTPEQDGARIDVPCLMVTAEWDPVLPPALAQGMPAVIDDLEVALIERCGHWTQQEQPAALNRLLLDWLGRRFPPG